MFGILKKNLQDLIGKFSRKKEEEPQPGPPEAAVEVPLPTPSVLPSVPVAPATPSPPPSAKPAIPAAPPMSPKPAVLPGQSKPKAPPAPKRVPAPPAQATPEPAPIILPAAVQKAPEPAIVREEAERPVEKAQKGGFFSRFLSKGESGKKGKPVAVKTPIAAEVPPAFPDLSPAEPKAAAARTDDPRGLMDRVKATITTRTISSEEFGKMFEELELILLENNVALEVVEHIKQDLEKELVDVPLRRGQIEGRIRQGLAKSVESLFVHNREDIIERIVGLSKEQKPVIVVFVGVNGSGKTTTVAKVAKLLKDRKLSCVLAAADTFRAAAIAQLEEHADRLGVRLIKHDYGADPAAVAFDAVKHAQAKGIDVVLIDTSGRMHSKQNLMEEMGKLIRVAKPHLKIFVGEATTGNDAVEQAKSFNEAIDLDGIVLAKADIDEKGGAAISVSFITGKPILAMGTGQGYDDLVAFDPHKVVEFLGLTNSKE